MSFRYIKIQEQTTKIELSKICIMFPGRCVCNLAVGSSTSVPRASQLQNIVPAACLFHALGKFHRHDTTAALPMLESLQKGFNARIIL